MKQIERLAKTLMELHGLKGWHFAWDNAKTRYGSCDYRKREITLSRHLTPKVDIDEARNTILHEIAHALVGHTHHHDKVWKAKALEIGCDGKRCGEEVELYGSFKGTCPNCQTVIYRHRRKQISCAKCDKKYNPQYLFRWEKVMPPSGKAIVEKKNSRIIAPVQLQLSL